MMLNMSNTQDELSKDVFIVNELGLHARAAAKLAEIAMKARSQVWISKEQEETVDAKSIIDMLSIACAKGTRITIKIESQSDENILNDIAQLVESGFGE